MLNNKGLWGRVALLGTALIWGSSFFIFKNTLNDIGTLWLLTIRFAVATVVFMAVCWRKVIKMPKRVFWGSVWMGLCMTAAYLFQTYGLVYTTAGKNAFLTASYCVIVPFLAWGFYKRKPGKHNVAASVLCIAGIGFASLDHGFGGMNIGDGLTLICGFFYALQIVMTEEYVNECDALPLTTVQFAVSWLVCMVLALLFEPAPQALPRNTYFTVAYLGVVSTAIAWFLQAWGMKYTPSSTATVLMTLESVFGVIFAALFANEKVSSGAMLGFVLILFSELLNELGAGLFNRKAPDALQ